ncbi:DUF4376 domain-containing protein [Neisseria uirgultaei]|uniref:DUF4376 domain-containing protein n=1 Tax=Neisseria uirgultaei TaxID=2830646 RepID=UPI00272C57C1|nr:DUF4376 domain-containing protein [Neisseria uirgultaei]
MTQKTVYQLDTKNLYIGSTVADLDPLNPENWLIPAGCIETAPPEIPEHHAARWTGEGWEILEDLRGQTAYRTSDGGKTDIEEVGALPEGLTLIPRPSEYHIWDGAKWKISKADAASLKTAAIASVWERIKQKRHENLRGGVYVESAAKWFHSTDEARQQYTFMRTLPMLPPDLMWKTMDGGFVKLTRELLDELSLKMLADEQKDFANAERHRALLEQAEQPETYDYSDGWTEIYKEES